MYLFIDMYCKVFWLYNLYIIVLVNYNNNCINYNWNWKRIKGNDEIEIVKSMFNVFLFYVFIEVVDFFVNNFFIVFCDFIGDIKWFWGGLESYKCCYKFF